VCDLHQKIDGRGTCTREFNTLEAQRESAEAYVQSQLHAGWTALAERYDDGGFTGANLERPALRKLLADIEAGRIDCVLVYKVARLSRSLLDFARLMEIFERHKVSLVSVTQPLNTTGSLGRLTLIILLSFAEFERQMIADRTSGAPKSANGWAACRRLATVPRGSGSHKCRYDDPPQSRAFDRRDLARGASGRATRGLKEVEGGGERVDRASRF